MPMLARQTVEQQADSAKRSEKPTSVLMFNQIADFLWTSDEPSARGYFTEAFKVAQERFREKAMNRCSGENDFTARDYRFEVIRAIAKFDGEWAKNFRK
jgi:hypothetical protein